MSVAKVKFFSKPELFNRWLAANHDCASELWVGLHKKGSGKPSLTWPESVDEALCYGWIDGLRKKGIDATSYLIRFTPRRKRSIWSLTNIRRVKELTKAGRMKPTGLRAFEARQQERSSAYAYEQNSEELPAQYLKAFKANKSARDFYQAQPPYYRKTVNRWIVSAKREATRLRRLKELITDCAAGVKIKQMRRDA